MNWTLPVSLLWIGMNCFPLAAQSADKAACVPKMKKLTLGNTTYETPDITSCIDVNMKTFDTSVQNNVNQWAAQEKARAAQRASAEASAIAPPQRVSASATPIVVAQQTPPTSPRLVADADVAKIHVGMPASEVNRILGKPSSKIQGDAQQWNYQLESRKWAKIQLSSDGVTEVRIAN